MLTESLQAFFALAWSSENDRPIFSVKVNKNGNFFLTIRMKKIIFLKKEVKWK
jgi:hypothetical protein